MKDLKFLPVIHVENKKQAINQTNIALDNGADGIFLINHSIRYYELIEIYEEIRKLFSNTWIGINCLDLEPIKVLKKIPKDVNGLWVDNAFIDEDLYKQEYATAVSYTHLTLPTTPYV